MRLWIFDLDGTLTNSFPLFFENMHRICSEHGVELNEELLRASLSGPLPQLFARLLGEERSAPAMARLLELSLEHSHRSPLYDGIEETLRILKEHGREIAVWTARDRVSAERLLVTTGLDRYVTELVSGCCVSQGKPHPEGAQLLLSRFGRVGADGVMVGDHEHDVSAAREAGLLGVRASWNSYWGGNACSIANHQFHDVPSFRNWVQEQLFALPHGK